MTYLSLPGRHNIANALAAAALTQSLGINLSIIKHGLESMSPVKGRLCVSRLPCGLTLIDDTYNASVQSVLAAIDTLATMPGFRVMVFGDMGELGVEAVELHRQVGEHARACNLDLFMAVGPLSIHAAQAAGGRHFADKSALFAALEELLSQHSDITLLAKGLAARIWKRSLNLLKLARSRHASLVGGVSHALSIHL